MYVCVCGYMYCIEFRESTSVKNCQQKLHVMPCNELIIYRKSGILVVFAHDISKKEEKNRHHMLFSG